MTIRTHNEVLGIWAEGQRSDFEYVMGNSVTNSLPWPKQPRDLAHFYTKTRDRILIMGRKTFESLPENMKTEAATFERPLLILTHSRATAFAIIDAYDGQRNIQPVSVQHHDIDPATQLLGVANMLWPYKDIAVIGGPAILEMFEPHYSRLVVTDIVGPVDDSADVLAPSESLLDGFSRVDYRHLSDTATAHYYMRRNAV